MCKTEEKKKEEEKRVKEENSFFMFQFGPLHILLIRTTRLVSLKRAVAQSSFLLLRFASFDHFSAMVGQLCPASASFQELLLAAVAVAVAAGVAVVVGVAAATTPAAATTFPARPKTAGLLLTAAA